MTFSRASRIATRLAAMRAGYTSSMRIILALLLLAGCTSDEPVDITGDYALATTNGTNGCGFANWTEGATSTGVVVKFRQTDTHFTAELTGLVRVYVELIVGSYIFAGEVAGSTFQATLAGTREIMEEGKTCRYRVNADIDGTLSRDTISGMLTYRV